MELTISIEGTGTKEQIIESLRQAINDIKEADEDELVRYNNFYWDEIIEVKINEK